MRTARFLSLTAAAIAAFLSTAPAAAEPKIAVISTSVLLREAPQIRSADQKLKAEFEKRERDLQTEERKFQTDYEKAQREADAMSAQQKATAQKDLFSRKSDLDLKKRQFTEAVQGRNAELQREVVDSINQAIEAVAREQGIDLVLRDPAFAAASLDITEAVLQKLAAMTEAPADPKKKKKK